MISLDFEAGFTFHAIEKLISVRRITHCARRDGRRSIDMRGIDKLPPLPEALQHPIHRRNAQLLGLIDALAQPQNTSLRSYFLQPPARRQIGNQQPAGERADIHAGETHRA